MRLLSNRLVLILSLVSALTLSGCIDASHAEDAWGEAYGAWEEGYEEWDEEFGSSSDEWEPECEEDDEDDSDTDSDSSDQTSGSDTNHSHDDDAEVDHDDIDGAFVNADPRYHNHVDGHEDSDRSINVNLGADELRVGLVHHLEGHVEIRLRNPLGMTVAKEEFDGHKETFEEDWYVVEDPLPGPWKLDIEIAGHGGYTVGFFLDD